MLKARWDWVDLADGTLLVPRSKNGKPRRIVLPPFAVEVLLEQQRHRHPGDGGFVFPGAVAGQPLGDCRGAFRRAKAAADTGGADHPRAAAQLGFMSGQRRRAAGRDRHPVGPPESGRHGPLRPLHAGPAGLDRRPAGGGVGPAGGTERCRLTNIPPASGSHHG